MIGVERKVAPDLRRAVLRNGRDAQGDDANLVAVNVRVKVAQPKSSAFVGAADGRDDGCGGRVRIDGVEAPGHLLGRLVIDGRGDVVVAGAFVGRADGSGRTGQIPDRDDVAVDERIDARLGERVVIDIALRVADGLAGQDVLPQPQCQAHAHLSGSAGEARANLEVAPIGPRAGDGGARESGAGPDRAGGRGWRGGRGRPGTAWWSG